MKKNLHRFNQFVHRSKASLICILVFTLLLLALPQVVSLLIPCLRSIPSASYSIESCNVLLVLDTFMLTALIGFALVVIVFFFFHQPRSFIVLTATALIMSVLIVLAYLLYIPKAETLIRSAPIILEKPTH